MARIAWLVLSKTTRKTYSAKFKMAVAVDVVRGDKTLSQVASEIVSEMLV